MIMLVRPRAGVNSLRLRGESRVLFARVTKQAQQENPLCQLEWTASTDRG